MNASRCMKGGIASVRRISPLAAAMWLACAASTSLADEPSSLTSPSGARLASTEGILPANVPIVLGSRSPALEQLALRLAERHPCLAVTLLQFDKADWMRARALRWQLPGLPSTQTVHLLVRRAAWPEIQSSMTPLEGTAYIYTSPNVELHIGSREEAGGRMITTLSGRIVSGEGVAQGLVEPEARIQWSRTDGRILSIDLSGETSSALAGNATLSRAP